MIKASELKAGDIIKLYGLKILSVKHLENSTTSTPIYVDVEVEDIKTKTKVNKKAILYTVLNNIVELNVEKTDNTTAQYHWRTDMEVEYV